jgi:hypothetical protein
MGDLAEGAFESAYPGKTESFGWNRPSVPMSGMSDFIKHQPDKYLHTSEGGYLVEVVGCGRDGLVKFRVTKLETLFFWHLFQPLRIYVWNSHKQEGVLVEWDDFREMLWASAVENGVKAFPSDGNRYVPVRFNDLKAVAV